MSESFQTFLRLSAERLAGELDPSDRNLWASRHIKEYIILMDHSSKEGASEQRLAIHTLRDILMNVCICFLSLIS